MPIHDWTRVDAGIFHAFHHSWIEEIARALNRGLLPSDYYALVEQFAAGFEPDVLTLQADRHNTHNDSEGPGPSAGGGMLLATQTWTPVAETDMAFYRQKQKVIAVRHVSGDRIVALVEIVCPGNKAARNPLRRFVEKAAEFLDKGVHLLVLGLHAPGKRDPEGIHGEIWQEIAGQEYQLPANKPLTLAAYEAGNALRVYIVHAAVGEDLSDMPLFLEPGKSIAVPLEATYKAAYAAMPRRWRRVLEAPRT